MPAREGGMRKMGKQMMRDIKREAASSLRSVTREIDEVLRDIGINDASVAKLSKEIDQLGDSRATLSHRLNVLRSELKQLERL